LLLSLWGFCFTLLLVYSASRAATGGLDTNKSAPNRKEAPVGAMVGSHLGLLAFLLAFTFGMAADAFQRKLALVDEANAIRTTYLGPS
jgi:hypothetical protein